MDGLFAINFAPHGSDPSQTRGLQAIACFLLASFTAQSLKILSKFVKTGQFDFRMLAKTGGMPSSHSCSTMGMAVTVGIIEGFTSVAFGIALVLSMIVMYDAAGVRRSVGLQSKVLNQIIVELFSDHPQFHSERIKELLGHTPFEVIVGAALGCLIAWVFNVLITGQL
jgi:acid phosphatase family membrane protein YuiD